MAGAIVQNLGNLFSISIDALWPYADYWASPIGRSLSAIFFDSNETIFTESASVQYTSVDIIGRAEPIQVWMGTDAREISFTFKFRAQGKLGTDIGQQVGGSNLTGINPNTLRNNPGVKTATDNIAETIESEVIQPAKFLMALGMPIIDESGIAHGPPPVRINVGRLLAMRAILKDCQVTWEGPIDPDTMLPHGASVQCTFSSVSRTVGNFNFNGPWRFEGNATSTVSDGPANPLSNLGTGFSGSGNQAPGNGLA